MFLGVVNAATYRLVSVVCAMIFALPAIAAAQDSAFNKNAKSCATSMCHGSAVGMAEGSIATNEHYVWLNHDLHAQATTVLSGALSKKIASRLTIKDPAKDPLCLSCHAGEVAQAAGSVAPSGLTGETGFQCLSCHGASGPWVADHCSGDGNHAKNVNGGLRDILPLDKRANLCLTCHQGSAKSDVTHKLLSGGHPRLTFELDTFTAMMPPHWQMDADYIGRKGEYVSIIAWMRGQQEGALASLVRIKRLGIDKKSLIPESSLFYCSTCHHSIANSDWRADNAASSQLGALRLNIAHLRMVGEVLEISSPPLALKYKAALGLVLANFPKTETGAHIEALSTLLRDEVMPVMNTIKVDATFANALFAQLQAFADKKGQYRFEDAEQVVMGMQSIIYSPFKPKNIDPVVVKSINDLLADPKKFSATKLAAIVHRINAARIK